MSLSRWKFTVEAFHYLTGNQSGNPCEEGPYALPRVEDVSFRNGSAYDRVTSIILDDTEDYLLAMMPAAPFVEAVDDFVAMIAEPAELPPVMKIYKSSIAYVVSPCREVRSAYLRLLLNAPGALKAWLSCVGEEDTEEKDLRVLLEKEICWLETEPEAFDEEGLATIRKRIPQGTLNGPPRKIH